MSCDVLRMVAVPASSRRNSIGLSSKWLHWTVRVSVVTGDGLVDPAEAHQTSVFRNSKGPRTAALFLTIWPVTKAKVEGVSGTVGLTDLTRCYCQVLPSSGASLTYRCRCHRSSESRTSVPGSGREARRFCTACRVTRPPLVEYRSIGTSGHGRRGSARV